MAGTMENKSEIEAMEEFAKQMWERYFKPKASEELLGHSLDGYKATVKTNNGDGTLTVTRPFDCCEQTLRCPPGLSETAQPGDQVLAVNLGDASNSFILCKTDLSGLGGGGGGGGADLDLLGDVAQITVDRLNTTNRVRKYFLQDTTDDAYLLAADGKIQFVVGTVTSQTPVQAQDRYGRNLYWEQEPESCTVDGDPLDANGNRVYSTKTATNWPVYTYTYSDTIAGSIKLGPSDYMDLAGLRRATEIDFSNFELGSITETVDGNVMYYFNVQFDASGDPVRIYDSEHSTDIVWW